MGIQSITGNTLPPQRTSYSSQKKSENTKTSAAASKETPKSESAAVYERSEKPANGVTKKTDYALIAKLKSDAEQRTAQLKSLVEKMMTKQGAVIGTADSMWRFLASGNFTVDEAAKAQAQAEIAEDGYWGVEQTSDRILDFAKALSGNDPEKADMLLDAFKKGFEEATKSWGKTLPDISQRTYDAVVEKFEAWKSGIAYADSAQTEA